MMPSTAQQIEYADIVIIGAGLSGVGAACHIKRRCPDKSAIIFEARAAIGGTWDLFRYPGVRSDSDMFTLGYRFRPWTAAKAIADAPDILRYIHETAAEYGIDRLVRFNRRVRAASWDSDDAEWTLTVEHTDTGEFTAVRCSFLQVCSGYYRYDQGFAPQFPGAENFGGRIVHPQHWPDDMDYSSKQVVVIGSGATAVTVVPSMAKSAAHVTMLQRSPTYIAAAPARDPIADWLRARLPQRVAYPVVRWKNALIGIVLYWLSRHRPELVKNFLRKNQIKNLPAGFDVQTHFTPTYSPWDQRMCLVPDADLFKAITAGNASIVTDRIREFTPTGILLESGTELPADVVVTATGLNMLLLGGMEVEVDGQTVDLSKTVCYKGMMLSGVPNLVWTVGYTNASWTLKADLIGDYFCRLLHHMDRNGYASVMPDPTVATATSPIIDLKSGYVLRSMDDFPKQGEKAPWRLHQNYVRDVRLMRRGPLDDDVIFTPQHNRDLAGSST